MLPGNARVLPLPELACGVPPSFYLHTGFSMSNNLPTALPNTVASITRSCVCLAAFVAPPIASAGIVNGGFEQPGQGYVLMGQGSTVGGWTCSFGSVEYVHAVQNNNLPYLQDSAFEGNYWMDLGGQSTGGIYQNVSGLTAGQAYRISFAQAGNVWGPNFNFSVGVYWNNQQVATFSSVHGGNDGRNMNWTMRSVDVVAGSGATNRLEFRALNSTAARGAALDAITIEPIPAPAAIAVILAAPLAIGRRRRG